MTDLKFPGAPFGPEQLADWLELTALSADDGNSSASDAERGLTRLNHGRIEEALGNMLTEIDLREKATGAAAYPFERKDTYIQIKSKAKEFPAYIFCLALSHLQWKPRKHAPENPWLLFEELARFSAKNYLGGEAILFGTSCRAGQAGKKRFIQRINSLAEYLGEGEGFRTQRTFSTKDSKLDLVAWKRFLDGRASQMILFGQCKAGGDWNKNLSELEADVFWDQWMKKGKVSAPLRTVFVPHRLFDEEKWELYARRARLLFDRCRIVAWAHKDTATGDFANRLLQCCRAEWKMKL